MLQRAVEAEEALRRELEEVRGELDRHRERKDQEERATSAAADAAAVEARLGELHGGAFFEKVAFHRQQKQMRFVRLTFDLKRIEWAARERGPFKVLPVDAILRVDYGDASRTFRCFEFGRKDRPQPGFCMSISTPSRSLDLIAKSERDIEMWVLGLNEVVPYRPERQRFTAQDFWVRRAILKAEANGPDDDVDESECTSNSTASTVSRRTASRVADTGSEISSGSRSRIRAMLPTRPAWGLSK